MESHAHLYFTCEGPVSWAIWVNVSNHMEPSYEELCLFVPLPQLDKRVKLHGAKLWRAMLICTFHRQSPFCVIDGSSAQPGVDELAFGI